MHPHHIFKSHIITGRAEGGFIPSCMTMLEATHFSDKVSELCDLLEQDPNYVISDPKDLYYLTINIHESRHFHDFIASPISFPFISAGVETWGALRDILYVLNSEHRVVAQPAMSHLADILRRTGDDPLRDNTLFRDAMGILLEGDLLHWFFLNLPWRFISRTGYLPNSLVDVDLWPLPSLPGLATDTGAIFINLRDIFEGSAVLTQVSYTATGLGTRDASKLWNYIESVCRKSSLYEYIICLQVLQSVFGEGSLFDAATIRVFRKIFRFALEGTIPFHPFFKLGYCKEEPHNLPQNRFASVVSHISRNKLQRDFVDDPDKVMEKISEELYPGSQLQLVEFMDDLNAVVGHREEFLGKSGGKPDFRSGYELLRLCHVGMQANKDEVDEWLDICSWGNGPKVLQVPLRLSELRVASRKVLRISEEYSASSLWVNLYIIDSLVNQYLYKSKMFCPLSDIETDCEKIKQTRGLIPLEDCDDDKCDVNRMAHYLGLRNK